MSVEEAMMEALEFLKERGRLCSNYKNCGSCPLVRTGCTSNIIRSDEACKELIATVEQWSKEHPRKTRQSVFLEQFPNAMLDTNGIIDISPCRVDPEQYPSNGKDCCKFQSCSECCREFWMQEVE